MSIVDFSEFSSLRNARSAQRGAVAAPVTDRWAQLHSPEPAGQMEARTYEIEPASVAEDDFWGDLQLRLAYPTHRLRRH